MEKAAKDMMSGVKLGPAALMATSKSININPIKEGDGKVNEGVGFEVTLISPPGHEDIHQGRQKGS